jgi:galactokinase
VDHIYIFTGSGLSSSAAFVCSSTIAIMAAFDVNFPKVCLLAHMHDILCLEGKI